MALLSSQVQAVAVRNLVAGARPVSISQSRSWRVLRPSVYQQQGCQRFFQSQLRKASTTSQSPKEAVQKTGAEAPSIKEKLPDPERTPFRFREFNLDGKVYVVTGGGR